MTRTRRGYIARRRRKKMRLFASSFRGAHSRLTRTITQHKIRALISAHRDRDRKKRDFRRLWITRINAVIRDKGVSCSYSRLINDLYKIKYMQEKPATEKSLPRAESDRLACLLLKVRLSLRHQWNSTINKSCLTVVLSQRA